MFIQPKAASNNVSLSFTRKLKAQLDLKIPMVGVTDDLFPLAILAYFRSGASLIGCTGLVYFFPKNHKFMVNVGKNHFPMDPMGQGGFQQQPQRPAGCGGYGH